MLFRHCAALDEPAPDYCTPFETIVHRSAAGRLYTIELSTTTDDPSAPYDARVAQMAAMNRTLGVCRGATREEALRKACALIDAAIPSGVPKAA